MDFKKDLVSVIIPIYGRFRETKKAINSVLDQDYENIEVIGIDDCSPEEIFYQLFGEYHDEKRVNLFQNNKNFGYPSHSRNVGISKAKGNYISLLDNDDYWLEEKISMQLYYFHQVPNIGLIHTNAINYIPRIKRIGGFKNDFYVNNGIITSSVMFKRETIKELVQPFDETIPCCDDWNLWIQINQNWEIGKLNDKLVKLNLDNNRLTNSDNYYKGRLIMYNKYKYEMKLLTRIKFLKWLFVNFILSL